MGCSHQENNTPDVVNYSNWTQYLNEKIEERFETMETICNKSMRDYEFTYLSKPRDVSF